MINRKAGTIKSSSKLLTSEFYRGKPRRYSNKVMKVINKMASRMGKTASGCGGTDTKMGSPMFYHPEYEPSSLLMPRDPIEVNAWSRYFYKYDALVSTAIDAHAELPISTIRLTLPPSADKKKARAIQAEYEEMCSTEYLDLFNKLLQIGVEYYKLGNVYPFAQWSDKRNKWVRITLLDPDYIELDKLQFTNRMRVDLRPNDRLKEIVNNGEKSPKTGLLYESLPSDLIEIVRAGMKIPLNSNPMQGSHVAHIAYKMADYDTLGSGLIERNFKPLVYKDRLRQAQDAIAARHLTPKHLIWAEATGNADVNNIREQVDNAFHDPDYAIITNYELHWELIGTGQSMMQLDSEWNWINEELMIGLMINKSFLLGEGSFANGQTVLEVMNQRYSIYRERLESWAIHNLFLPMAKRNDWAEYEEGTLKKEKKIRYLYPRIKWNRLNFVDDTAHKQMLSQMVNAGQLDMQTWLEAFGLDAETVKERLERFEGTPLDVNYFEEMRSVASEVGRALAPAIAKLRAEQKGLELPKDDKGNMQFADGTRMKMVKTGAVDKDGNDVAYLAKILPEGALTGLKVGIEGQETVKEAETREQRAHERRLRRKDREIEDKNKELQVEDKLVKPPRNDLRKPKLFEAELAAGILVDPDKADAAVEKIAKNEQADDLWVDKMNTIGMDQNARRAMSVMEERLAGTIGLNGSASKERIKIIREGLPQIFASKISGNDSLKEKTAKARERFGDIMMDLSYKVDTIFTGAKNLAEAKQVIRNEIEKVF